MKSIVTDYENISAFSGLPKECDHHLIFGRGLKKLADEDSLILPLMNCEHNASSRGLIYQIHENPAAEHLSKMLGQACWERRYIANLSQIPFYDIEKEAREAFRRRYGISYL